MLGMENAAFLRFPAATHILRVNCAEMAGDGPGQPAYQIFSIAIQFTYLLIYVVSWLVTLLLSYRLSSVLTSIRRYLVI